MRLFGFELTRSKIDKGLSPIGNERGGWYRVLESFSGAFQQNVEVNYDSVLANHAIYACATLAASDVAKLRLKLVERDADLIWTETTNPAYSPVLRKPNAFQNRIQFWESWMLSKLLRGNTYVLKQRDNRGVVVALYVLDSAPGRVRPLVSDDGAVFYELRADNISGVQDTVVVPAREIIHDRFNCLYHPLVGISPIFASGLAATQGLRIQNDSASFFGNKSRPGGILTAPGAISTEIADRLKAHWDSAYSGDNIGKVAVLSDGLAFQPIAITAEESQLIEQLKWTAEVVCSAFHVPPYKIGIGPMPTYSNIQALNVEYYSQCLQRLIEDAEICLDEGLEIRDGLGTEFDLDGLLRMDSVTQMTVLRDAVGAAVMAPNEARRKIDLKPVKGGEAPLSQQQNYSLEALSKRDAKADPFATEKVEPLALPAPAPTAEETEKKMVEAIKVVVAPIIEKLVAVASTQEKMQLEAQQAKTDEMAKAAAVGKAVVKKRHLKTDTAKATTRAYFSQYLPAEIIDLDYTIAEPDAGAAISGVTNGRKKKQVVLAKGRFDPVHGLTGEF